MSGGETSPGATLAFANPLLFHSSAANPVDSLRCPKRRCLAALQIQSPFCMYVVFKSRAAQGPATIERFACADGSAAGKAMAYDEKAPAWAKPFTE